MKNAFSVSLLFCLSGLFSGAAEKLLLHESYERGHDLKTVIHIATKPYTRHFIGVTDEKAFRGRHSLKIDVTCDGGFYVYLTPRSNARPDVLWDGGGGVGQFVIPGLDNITFNQGRAYVLRYHILVERASDRGPVRVAVQTVSASDYGPTRMNTDVGKPLCASTGKWILVEQELRSHCIEKLEAGGFRIDSLGLNALLLLTWVSSPTRITAFVDEISLVELPFEEYERPARQPVARPYSLKSYPSTESFFPWGVYGSAPSYEPGKACIARLERGREGRLQQIRMVEQDADWALLNLRRHYCNTVMGGGGMLFPQAGQESYDYVKLCLDKCAEYGIKMAPTTFITRHYHSQATKEECLAAMRRVARFGRDHPGLLAYLLVDEPQKSTADDFYWGKQAFEEIDPTHMSICCLNGMDAVEEFAPRLPIVMIDYYPLGSIPSGDKGPWAIAAIIRYARKLGAKRIWSLPQCFGNNSWRPPTRAEFSLQIFSALAEGATGFVVYAHAEHPRWLKRGGEYGRLVDPYGNPSAAWNEMRRLGPYLRSAGPLLIGCERLPDAAVKVETRGFVVSNVGRKAPVVVARMFSGGTHGARFIVVYNNTRFYQSTTNVVVDDVAADDELLDMFALRNVPLYGHRFTAFLKPGAGRVYALALRGKIDAIRKEVLSNRYAIERDLLLLEMRTAGRMGTDVTAVERLLDNAEALYRKGNRGMALEALSRTRNGLEAKNRENIEYQRVNDRIERCMRTLGIIHRTMSRRIGNGTEEFAADLPEVKKIAGKMLSLSERFYALRSGLTRKGPAGLRGDAEKLLSAILEFEIETRHFFGI